MNNKIVQVELNGYPIRKGYSGKQLKFKIGYVLPLDAERVVFSLLPAPTEKETNGI